MTTVERTHAMLVVSAGVLIVLAMVAAHWLLVLVALAGITLVAAVSPSIVVAAVVASIPVQSSVMFSAGRGEVTLTQLLLFGLVAGWGMVFWRRKIWLDSIVIGFLLVLAAYSISFIAVDNPGLWLQETYRWAIAGVFYVICRSVIDSWQSVRWCMWAMVSGVTSVSLLSLWQLGSELRVAGFQVGGALRVAGTFGTPNPLAAYMEMTVPLLLTCLYLAWRKRASFRINGIEKWLLAVASSVGIIVALFTRSRGGWIGLALGCGVVWWQMPHRIKVVSFVTAAVVIGGFLLTPPGQLQVSRFLDLQPEADTTVALENRSLYEVGSRRGALWSTAMLMLKDRPLTGIGAGEFDENFREYVPSWIDRHPRGQAHNVWLQMGAQAGIWGIAAYGAWFVASVWSVVTARRRARTDGEYWLVTGVLAVFVAYAAHSMVDYLNVLSLGLQLSVLTAVALNLVPEPLSRYALNPRTVPPSPASEPAW